MKNILLTLVIILFTQCSDKFEMESQINKSISFINSNYIPLKEIINLSKELYERNNHKHLSISIIQGFKVSCEQVLNEKRTNYCVGLNWNCDDIRITKEFSNQLRLDSISLVSIQRKMSGNKIIRIDLENNIIEFLFRNTNCTVSYDLKVNLKDKSNLENKINLEGVERPCSIDIGDGFRIDFEILEHGITQKRTDIYKSTCT